MAEDGEEHAVHADRCLDAVGDIAFIGLGIEVLDLLAGDSLVVAEVEVGS